jgi:sugar lactone lactonase YvrE
MKTKKPVLKRLSLAASALLCCALHLPAQTAPTITTQPASQTHLAGANVTFSVAVSGTGPFTYQWQFNGANLPTIITTVAGNGAASFSGDGGMATNASLNGPQAVALDALENLYIYDTYNNRIREVDTNGTITTMAGNGSALTNSGYSGNGGAATNASLNHPGGGALDTVGNLYIADSFNNCVRKVDTNGIITTVAGNNSKGYSGDGGVATSASLDWPYSVALDAFDNLFIADTLNNRIRKVDTSGIITTMAGSGTAGYSGDSGAATNANLNFPTGLALDAMGNLYIADQENNRIRKVSANGIITTVAGNGTGGYSGDGGAATNASLNGPSGLGFDAIGNLYIADPGNSRIREVDPNGFITTVAGSGIAAFSGDGGAGTNASLNNPIGVALDAVGNLYVADFLNQRIREVHFAGLPALTLTNVSAGNAGNYTVIVTSPFGSVTSALATLTVEAPPVITVQPASQIVLAGSNAVFSVGVTGSAPFEYSWYSASTNLVQSGTNSTLTLTGISTTDAGSYTVVVTNAWGSVTSQVAGLQVTLPVITILPASQTVPAGANAVFSVVVAGSGPFEYSWYFASTNLLQSGTNSTLTLMGVSAANAGNYKVVATSSYCSVTSQVATLTVLAPPLVVNQPVSQTALPGTDVTFTVGVVGTGPFTYLWQFNGTNLPNDIISTVAGNGVGGIFGHGVYSGDGAAATSANLFYPTAVVLDASGDLYIADEQNNRIRMVDANGIITTVAGDGPTWPSSASFSGDGGPATNANIADPIDVALDAAGNLYIADDGNACIRKVNTNGIITTVAGKDSAGYSGDGGPATSATLCHPCGVALDAAGNVYIADFSNNRIRKVGTNGIIITVAGTGNIGYSGDGGAATNADLYYPAGLALDEAGDLYIADGYNHRIRKVDTNGIITSVAGHGPIGPSSGSYSGDGGAATNANLNFPTGVALDAVGNLYIVDQDNHRIRKVGTNGMITTVAGHGPTGPSSGSYSGDGGAATNASLNYPNGLALDSAGNLYIADTGNDRVREVLLYAGYPTLTVINVDAVNGGNYTVVITSPYGIVTSAVATLTVQAPPLITIQPASQIVVARSNAGFSVAVAGSGPCGYLWYFDSTNLLQSGQGSTFTVADVSTNEAGNYTVVVTNVYGSVTSQVAALTVAFPPTVIAPPDSQSVLAGSNASFSVTAGGSGPFRYVWQYNGANFPTNIITTVAGNGGATYAGDGGAATNASLNNPTGLALDAMHNLYIADYYNQRIRKVDTNGIITTVAGNGTYSYSGDGGAATNASLGDPSAVALDSSGNLYIADTFNCRIRKVDSNGIITTVAGNGPFGFSGDGGPATNAGLTLPVGVALDAAGHLYIADKDNQRIRKVDSNAIITTVAGNANAINSYGGSYTGGFSGDGGAANLALLNYPTGDALDAAGNLYIADSGSARIRKVDIYGIITTVAGGGLGGDGGAATNAGLYLPQSVAGDVAGNLYIADTHDQRIRMVGANGIISTVAGNGSQSYSGDGGAATSASLDNPACVALDAAGNLYIADSGNDRVREVDLAGYPVLTLTNVSGTNAGNYSVVITSPYGSVTSAVATLTVTIPSSQPQIITYDGCFGFVTNQFGFNLSGATGQTIVVDGSTDLVNWTPLCTNTVGASAVYFCDPCWTNFGWRFYRARLK